MRVWYEADNANLERDPVDEAVAETPARQPARAAQALRGAERLLRMAEQLGDQEQRRQAEELRRRAAAEKKRQLAQRQGFLF